MKILFLCGSLEPGKDGVGDYTTRLAGELARQGHTISIAAMYDKHLAERSENREIVDGKEIVFLRLPFQTKNKTRYEVLKKWCESFRPDFISLQYVPYSFSKTGAPLLLGKSLKQIYQGTKWHVMVHEPFLSTNQITYKNRVIRQLQILSLRLIKNQLHPLWHTSIPYYQKRLKDAVSIDCKILGLFGNIPVLEHSTLHSKNLSDERTVKAVFFGSVPPAKHQAIFIKKFTEQIPDAFTNFQLIFCGKQSEEANNFINLTKSNLSAFNCTVIVLGILSEEKLSELFYKADLGIARVPPYLLGKSGCAIAMLEHGLPLWLPMAENDDDWNEIDFRSELCFSGLQKLKSISNKYQSIDRLPHIAQTMISDFIIFPII